MRRDTLRRWGRPRSAPALLLTVAIVTLVVSIVGLVGSIMVNAFALDKVRRLRRGADPGSRNPAPARR